MDNSFDLSKVISLITENPEIIAQISALAKGTGEDKKPKEATENAASKPVGEESTAVNVTPAKAPISEGRPDTRNRQRLLSAFKPYLSGERAKAIDSMITITEILGNMGGR